MRPTLSLFLASAAAGLMGARGALAQTAPATPTPAPPAASTPAPTVPVGPAPVKLADTPIVTTLKLPADNPLGADLEAPAALTAKPVFNEFVITAPFFATMRVDPAGKVIASKRVRDPIPSLTSDTKKSIDRWVFEPAHKAGQPAETWASVRVDLAVAVRLPKVEQVVLTPVTPSTSIPSPFDWGSDAAWYDSLKVTPASDGTIPVEQVDTPPNPKKTPWYADSFKGPFSCRLWVKISAAGHVEKVVPIQVSDPVLIAYFRHELPSWSLHPARVKGQGADSWNEIVMSGTVGYSIEIKQILSLRKTIAGG
jgi:hypothetical protein